MSAGNGYDFHVRTSFGGVNRAINYLHYVKLLHPLLKSRGLMGTKKTYLIKWPKCRLCIKSKATRNSLHISRLPCSSSRSVCGCNYDCSSTIVADKLAWIDSLTHWGRVTPICVSKLAIIGSDTGLSPGRHQAIISINAGILLIRILGTNFSEIVRAMHAFLFKKIHLKMSSAKWRPFCLGLNVLRV